MFKTIIFWSCLIIFFIQQQNEAILDGDPVDWLRHGYLVKVLARSEEGGRVQSCSGTLITDRLVLTAYSCLRNQTSDSELTEIAIIFKKLNSMERQYVGTIVEKKNQWALLKIRPQNISEICPPRPQTKRISRLNIRPSLTKSSIIDLPFESFQESRCYMVGFETSPNASTFITDMKVLRLNIEGLYGPIEPINNNYRARVTLNYTACFDDTGAALICYSTEHAGFFQVGIFQALVYYEGTQLDRSNIKMCQLATDMEFSLINSDQDLVAAIENNGIAEFDTVYRACEYR